MKDKHPSNKENKIFTVKSINVASASNFSRSFNSHPQQVYGVVHTNICSYVILLFLQRLKVLIYALLETVN